MAPGGSTSPSALASVEQYSAATHRARPTSSAGTPSSSARSGASSRSSSTSLRSERPVTTPRIVRAPNGTTSIEPTVTPSRSGSGSR